MPKILISLREARRLDADLEKLVERAISEAKTSVPISIFTTERPNINNLQDAYKDRIDDALQLSALRFEVRQLVKYGNAQKIDVLVNELASQEAKLDILTKAITAPVQDDPYGYGRRRGQAPAAKRVDVEERVDLDAVMEQLEAMRIALKAGGQAAATTYDLKIVTKPMVHALELSAAAVRRRINQLKDQIAVANSDKVSLTLDEHMVKLLASYGLTVE